MLEKFLIFIIWIKIYKGIVGLKLFLAFGILELFISRIFLVWLKLTGQQDWKIWNWHQATPRIELSFVMFTNVRNSFSGKHDLCCPDQHFLISTCEFSWNKQAALLSVRFLLKSWIFFSLNVLWYKEQARAELD